ncbi:hypothetical protein ACHWQZ_G013608 [Mnemiopsis leidyi]
MNALIAAAFDNEYVDQEIVQDLGSEATESVVQKLNFDEGIENDKDSTVDHSAQDCSNNCAEVTTDEAAQDTREYQVVECQETSAAGASNLGVLSDFSDQASSSTISTSIAPETLGQMDEIQACMISISDADSRSKEKKATPLKSEISNREDLSLILKRIVLLCDSADRRCQDVLYASLRALSSYIESSTDPTVLSDHIQSEIRSWLSAIVRLPDYTPYLYKSSTESLVALTESLLFSNYPAIAQDGLFALYAKYPVIYMSAEDAELYSSPILSRFYLPKSVISVVPYNISSPNSRTLDIKAFERLVSDDVACGKLPMLAVTTIGTEVTGHIDNIPAIKHMCDRHGIWLHAKGSCSPLLSLPSPPPTVKVFSDCDSVTVPSNNLLRDSSAQTSILFINSESDQVSDVQKLDVALPFWVLLQHQGSLKISASIQDSFNLAVQLYNELKSFDSIQLLEYPLTGHVVCFRYYSLLEGLPDLSEQEPMNKLMSKLTLMMFETLEQQFGSEKIQLIQFSGNINVIRLAPLDNCSLTLEDLPLLLSSIKWEMDKFETSLRMRETFNQEIQGRDNFLLVLDPLHPSVGAFQYLPKYLQDEEACNTPEGGEELNEINQKICDYLEEKWRVISTRQVARFTVISIPLITESLDIQGLLDDIVKTAPKFENNSKYLARMSEIIRKGIDQANEELQMESEQQFYEKGIIRQIPLFGSVFNWILPIEEKIIVGRSFSLHSGAIKPTDIVYSVAGTPSRSRTTSSSSYNPNGQ